MPAAYYIEHALVFFDQDNNKEKQLKQLESVIRSHDPQHTIRWETSFWINEDELAADKQFITMLKPGQISEPIQTAVGFELFKLIDKREARLKTLDERYGAIVNFLRRPKYGELMEKFQQDLLDSASIILFDLPSK